MLSAGMAISGTAGLFSIESGQPTLNVIFFRCVFGAIALVGWSALREGWKSFFIADKALWPLVIVSGVCLVLNWVALFQAFKLTSIGFATIIYHLQPFWITLAGAFLLKEGLSRDKLGWICVAFLGLVLTILPKLGVMRADHDWLVGVGLALVASLSDFFVFGRSITAMQGAGLVLILLAGLAVNLGWPFLFGSVRRVAPAEES